MNALEEQWKAFQEGNETSRSKFLEQFKGEANISHLRKIGAVSCLVKTLSTNPVPSISCLKLLKLLLRKYGGKLDEKALQDFFASSGQKLIWSLLSRNEPSLQIGALKILSAATYNGVKGNESLLDFLQKAKDLLMKGGKIRAAAAGFLSNATFNFSDDAKFDGLIEFITKELKAIITELKTNPNSFALKSIASLHLVAVHLSKTSRKELFQFEFDRILVDFANLSTTLKQTDQNLYQRCVVSATRLLEHLMPDAIVFSTRSLPVRQQVKGAVKDVFRKSLTTANPKTTTIQEAHQWQWAFNAVWHLIVVGANTQPLCGDSAMGAAVAILIILIEEQLVDMVKGDSTQVFNALLAVRWNVWVGGELPMEFQTTDEERTESLQANEEHLQRNKNLQNEEFPQNEELIRKSLEQFTIKSGPRRKEILLLDEEEWPNFMIDLCQHGVRIKVAHEINLEDDAPSEIVQDHLFSIVNHLGRSTRHTPEKIIESFKDFLSDHVLEKLRKMSKIAEEAGDFNFDVAYKASRMLLDPISKPSTIPNFVQQANSDNTTPSSWVHLIDLESQEGESEEEQVKKYISDHLDTTEEVWFHGCTANEGEVFLEKRPFSQRLENSLSQPQEFGPGGVYLYRDLKGTIEYAKRDCRYLSCQTSGPFFGCVVAVSIDRSKFREIESPRVAHGQWEWQHESTKRHVDLWSPKGCEWEELVLDCRVGVPVRFIRCEKCSICKKTQCLNKVSFSFSHNQHSEMCSSCKDSLRCGCTSSVGCHSEGKNQRQRDSLAFALRDGFLPDLIECPQSDGQGKEKKGENRQMALLTHKASKHFDQFKFTLFVWECK